MRELLGTKGTKRVRRGGALLAISLATAGLVTTVAERADAQGTQTSLAGGNGSGINTRLFRAAVDSKGFFTVNGSDVIGKGDFAFGLVLDGGYTLLRLQNKSPSGVDRDPTHVIANQFHGNLFINYSPLRDLVVGIGIPVDLTSGDPLNTGSSIAGVTADNRKTDINAFFTGAWNINLKYRLLRVENGLGIALIGAIDLPAGQDARIGYAADPGISFHPTVAFEKRFGGLINAQDQRFRVGLNLGASIITGSGSKIGDLAAGDPGKTLQHGNLGRAGLAISFRASESLDLVAETYGSYLLKNDAGGTAGTSAEAVGGIKVFVESNSYLFLGGGVGYLKGYQAANERIFLGFIFEPSIGDRDHDGIKDDIDKCPDQPEDKDGFQDDDGCPDPDNDNDGILDKDDACPDKPETKNGIADDDGCPDGIDGDRDHDGIKDSVDKCPDDPEDKDGFQDTDGCPDPDNDKDGILDKDDKCPLEPEVFNGFEDEDGCPDKGKVIIEGSTIVILEKIQFDYNSAAIKKESMPIVEQVAATLKGHPEFSLVEVEGHADERGDDNYNLHLTQARVDSVMAAMTARGVEKSRLYAVGFGEYCPIDSAHNDAAWEKNRRVEFKILKTKDGPTGVDRGCKEALSKGVVLKPVQ